MVAVMLLVYVLLFKNLLRKTLSWRAKRCIFVSELFLVNFCTWKSSALSKYLSTSNWLWCHSWPNNLVDDGTGGIQLLILCCCSLARFFKHNMTGAAPKCGFSGQILPPKIKLWSTQEWQKIASNNGSMHTMQQL